MSKMSIWKLSLAGLAAAALAMPALAQTPTPVKGKPVYSEHGKRPKTSSATEKSEVALSSEDTEGRFTIQDEIWGPTMAVPPHFHKTHGEVFYLISGQLQWTVSGETHLLNPGDLQLVPPNSVHSVKVMGGKEAHVLFISSPGGYEQGEKANEMLTPEQRKDPKLSSILNMLSDYNPVK